MKVKSIGLCKISLILVVIIMLIGILQVNVQAEPIQNILNVSDDKDTRSLLDDVDSVTDKAYVRQRSSHLDFGVVELSKVSATRARISASTQAFHVCPEVHLDIYVDQYDEAKDEWTQWRYWEYSANDVDHLTKNMEIIVQSGHYYSVRGYHMCVHGSSMEVIETMTDGLYIGLTSKPVI